jgi:hypothetical protein
MPGIPVKLYKLLYGYCKNMLDADHGILEEALSIGL